MTEIIDSDARCTGDQVVQAAIQLEQAGEDFYIALATACDDPQTRQMAMSLARQEANHQRVFRRMRGKLASQNMTVLLSDALVSETRKLLRKQVLPELDQIKKIASTGGVGDLLRMAIELEKEAVCFYQEMAGQFVENDAIQGVIAEERNHVRILKTISGL